MKPEVSQAHRRELLRFLLTKTAAVRSGVSGSAFLLTVPDTFFICSVPIMEPPIRERLFSVALACLKS